MSEIPPFKSKTVLVIGLGQLGLPVAKYVKSRGFDVYGYDIRTEAMVMAEKIYGIKISNHFKNFDIYIICISTHKQNDIHSPQTDDLFSIVKRISFEAQDGALVSIESTIPKGTSKTIFELLEHRLHLVHAPHRWYSLDEEKHGVNQLRIIGGVNSCCLRIGLNFYSGNINTFSGLDEGKSYPNFRSLKPTNGSKSGDLEINTDKEDDFNSIKPGISLGIKMHTVSSIEIAELTKIIENSHRYLQIAFAEELYLYCQANDISFSELRDALNTKWNVEILEPRDGIDGHCLPKDTKMFMSSSQKIQSKILRSAMEIDSAYRNYRELRSKKIVDQITNVC
jgi:UDP-N-acetyl-D-mannosaminuronate dehydrogenase